MIMKNKVLICLYVPTLDNTYDIYIPVNELVWRVNKLLVKSISDLTEGILSTSKNYILINIDNGRIYNNNEVIINTDIRNLTRIALIEI